MCAASSVEVETVNMGDKAGYNPVFEVTVRNRCGCAVRGVFLRSEGFASSVAVAPCLFRREGRDYLVGDGRRIESGAAVRFWSAWDRAFRMAPAAVARRLLLIGLSARSPPPAGLKGSGPNLAVASKAGLRQ